MERNGGIGNTSLQYVCAARWQIVQRKSILLAQEKNGPVARASAPRHRNIPIILPF